jgi:ubiquinone/menaquinone biosynthesis C-methylase UbiE
LTAPHASLDGGASSDSSHAQDRASEIPATLPREPVAEGPRQQAPHTSAHTQPTPTLGRVPAGAYDLLTSNALWREHAAGLLSHVPAEQSLRRVLDLGCGPGMSVFSLAAELGPDVEVCGLDFSPGMIRRARHHQRVHYAELSNVHFAVADATRLPFADASFDLATGHSFLYLVGDQDAVLREIRRVLTPGGSLALMEPNANGSLLRATWAARRYLGELFRRPLATLRFALSMVTWRLYSALVGRLKPEVAEALLKNAGFEAVASSPTLAGMGLHCRGRVGSAGARPA